MASLIQDAEFDGSMTAQAPSEAVYDQDGRDVSYVGTAEKRPDVGAAVDLYYLFEGGAAKRIVATLPNTEYPPTQGRTEKFGAGTISAVHYKPGRSGKLYPYVDVEVADAR